MNTKRWIYKPKQKKHPTIGATTEESRLDSIQTKSLVPMFITHASKFIPVQSGGPAKLAVNLKWRVIALWQIIYLLPTTEKNRLSHTWNSDTVLG